MLSAEELTYHIDGCTQNRRESQKAIYVSFYEYAMSICSRYANDPEDAVEILNDGFLKIFKMIYQYKPAYADVISSFKGWTRKIMYYTAIDHYRSNRKHNIVTALDDTASHISSNAENAEEKITYKEILQAIQNISPAYQAVLRLSVIEGLGHKEISEKLEISVGTSKSNLSKARKQLQKILFRQNDHSREPVT